MGLPEGIVRRAGGGFVVHMKDDGTEYFRLVKACIDENIDYGAFRRNFPAAQEVRIARDGMDILLHVIAYMNPKRTVFRFARDGREFILKRAITGSVGLRRLFPGVMGLTYFTNVMRRVNAAVRAGCRATQEYYCVAERWLSPFRQEVWALIECVPGHDLMPAVPPPRRDAVREAALDILRHGLTLDDMSPGNFIDDGERVRLIDLSCRPLFALHAAKMRLKMKALHGVELPARGVLERICAALPRWRR